MQDDTHSSPLSPGSLEQALRALESAASQPEHGLEIPGCRILRELYRGGQGVVYQAIQTATGRVVAVKVLVPRGASVEKARRRFLREVQLIAKLQHPHIVTLYDSGKTADDRLYYVMEYIEGSALRKHVRAKRLTLEEVLTLFVTLCDAVEALHARGIVHRDLKPSNVLVDARGRLVVLDLGLAVAQAAPIDVTLSQPGDLLGTLAYMSPEQTSSTSLELDARSDVYALGVMLFEALTGSHPYSLQGTIEMVVERIRESQPFPLTEAWNPAEGVHHPSNDGAGSNCPLDKDIETIVRKALAKDCALRYDTAGELCADLRRYLAGESISARPPSPLAYVASGVRRQARRHPLSAVLLAALVGWMLSAGPLDAWVQRGLQVDRAVSTWLTGSLLEPASADRLSRVVVVGITDDTDVAALAKERGFTDVSPNHVRSWRRLHGEIMRRLARSGCRVVVFDILFRQESEFDETLLDGVRALAEQGIPVIMAVEPFWSGDRGLDALAPDIAAVARWGSVAANFRDSEDWSVPVVLMRDGKEVLRSMSLETLAAVHAPTGASRVLFDPGTAAVQVADQLTPTDDLWRSVPRYRHVGSLLTRDVRMPDDAESRYGVRAGDMVGDLRLPPISDAAMAASTLEYGEVLTGEPTDWDETLAGRVVVIGNLRTSAADRFRYPDGRTVSGVYGQAVAIDALLRESWVRVSPLPERWSLGLVGALVGLCTARWAGGRWGRGVAALAIAAIGFLFVACSACYLAQWVINPGRVVLAAVMTFALVAALHRASGLLTLHAKERVS